VKYSFGRFIQALGGLHEAAHKAPFASFGLEASFYQQKFQVLSVKAENNYIHGYQVMLLSRIMSHI